MCGEADQSPADSQPHVHSRRKDRLASNQPVTTIPVPTKDSSTHRARRSRGRESISADQLQGFQVFLDNLSQAILQQLQTLASSEQLVAHRFSVWQERHTKLKMLESITNRYMAAESIEAEKLAQKEIDELGQGVYQFYKK